MGWGSLEICHIFTDPIIFKQQSNGLSYKFIVHFWEWGCVGGIGWFVNVIIV